ncbi:hypothetical protein RCG24_09130 [Neobacillus sp. OS1-32]|jgi:hypothetical protein|uniref:Lipoprotein n=1 Tax=Neobacillus paridis TaxID=2803862 RepID=A0ABS1TP38_9BACI|nr:MULTISPECIES: hypothetical protein [Neobacillus]MBL4952499.1 hypothetical protein [Neobacillus paridis]WML31976.1 hypothetical protein RCG24_09130 [Neobacillus sp. OS1-32]
MQKNIHKVFVLLIVIIGTSLLSGCGAFISDESIVSRYADALLTKNNELQFRFRINNEIIQDQQLYKVKVLIHDDRLAAAIGKREIVYGEDLVLNGEYLDVKDKREKYIFMDPIPLKEDLHIQELQNMIEQNHAVSIEVFNNKEVLARAYLTNFSSEL